MSWRIAKSAGLIAAAYAVTLSPAAAAPKENTHIYGPEPTWDQFRELAEADIRSGLLDPESARFTWETGFFKGELKIILGARTAGYVACGYVNAKNRMGGYVGAEPFAVVIDYGRVLYSSQRNVGVECSMLKAAGKLPPVPDTHTAAGASSNAAGFALRPMPEGAYVSAVSDGSAAAAAGLRPGMVITSVNAIPLAGMDAGMLKVIEAAGATATLTVVGGTTLKLGAKP